MQQQKHLPIQLYQQHLFLLQEFEDNHIHFKQLLLFLPRLNGASPISALTSIISIVIHQKKVLLSKILFYFFKIYIYYIYKQFFSINIKY